MLPVTVVSSHAAILLHRQRIRRLYDHIHPQAISSNHKQHFACCRTSSEVVNWVKRRSGPKDVSTNILLRPSSLDISYAAKQCVTLPCQSPHCAESVEISRHHHSIRYTCPYRQAIMADTSAGVHPSHDRYVIHTVTQEPRLLRLQQPPCPKKAPLEQRCTHDIVRAISSCLPGNSFPLPRRLRKSLFCVLINHAQRVSHPASCHPANAKAACTRGAPGVHPRKCLRAGTAGASSAVQSPKGLVCCARLPCAARLMPKLSHGTSQSCERPCQKAPPIALFKHLIEPFKQFIAPFKRFTRAFQMLRPPFQTLFKPYLLSSSSMRSMPVTASIPKMPIMKAFMLGRTAPQMCIFHDRMASAALGESGRQAPTSRSNASGWNVLRCDRYKSKYVRKADLDKRRAARRQLEDRTPRAGTSCDLIDARIGEYNP